MKTCYRVSLVSSSDRKIEDIIKQAIEEKIKEKQRHTNSENDGACR